MSATAVTNARSLIGTNIKPMFVELWERGRWDIPRFASDFLDIDLHDGQKKWVNTAPWADERLLASGNRWGKSLLATVKCLHHTLYQTRLPKYANQTQRYIVINLSLTLDMANIVWDQAFLLALDSPFYRRFVLEDQCKRTPFPTMVIGDRGGGWRSELWARSTTKKGKHLLGKDFDFINYDEAARDPDGPMVRDDVLLMRLADRNGRIDYTSTGNFRNWYYQEWVEADREYRGARNKAKVIRYAQTGSSYENPYIDHDKLKRTEDRLGEQYRLQNIHGGFASTAAVFNLFDIEKCYKGQDYALPVEPVRRADYIMAVDWGRRYDETVIVVARIDERPAKLVYARSLGGLDVKWQDIYELVADTHYKYNDAFVLIDSTGQQGDIHLDTLRNTYGMVRLDGYNFSGSVTKKEDLITAGQRALQGRWIVWPYIPDLYDQLCFYDRDDAKLTTDWAMAWCLLGMAYIRETWVDHNIQDTVYSVEVLHQVPGEGIIEYGPWERLAQDYYGEGRANA